MNVRKWHDSDVRSSAREVRSALLSGHAVVSTPCLNRATSGSGKTIIREAIRYRRGVGRLVQGAMS